MGMKEERLNWAAATEDHAKRLFAATKNPYYVIEAIAAARTAEWKVPNWALDCLLDAVKRAYWSAYMSSKLVSIDEALGVKAKRGGTPPKLRAYRDSDEVIVFDDILILHGCFEIAIPDACELVYNEIDFHFAREMNESISEDIEISDEELAKIRMTREQINDLNRKARETRESLVAIPFHTPAVREKLIAKQWWQITTGDRLGYGVERLIERYHKRGAKIAAAHWAGMNADKRKISMHLRGSMLLDARCCRFSGQSYMPADLVRLNPLADLRPREDFGAFLEWCTGWKSHISDP
jgi:hypothetical protein